MDRRTGERRVAKNCILKVLTLKRLNDPIICTNRTILNLDTDEGDVEGRWRKKREEAEERLNSKQPSPVSENKLRDLQC